VKGNIYLIPVTLGDVDYTRVIPEKVLDLTRNLRYFIVEDIRSARRFLRLIDKSFPIDSCEFFELNEHTRDSEISDFLIPAMNSNHIGIMSEAGLPGLADPGSKVVLMAHEKHIKVIPQSGPSSIILALIASGLNGQNFTFNGYLPVKPSHRIERLRELEKAAEKGFAQIFMETPYRNQQMLESVLATCHNSTRLCIAEDISLPTETIRTMSILDWKKNIPPLKGKLVVFVMQ
jgi:16S rRNA (cytidine1402-2'-O)-methyltransferase